MACAPARGAAVGGDGHGAALQGVFVRHGAHLGVRELPEPRVVPVLSTPPVAVTLARWAPGLLSHGPAALVGDLQRAHARPRVLVVRGQVVCALQLPPVIPMAAPAP